MEKPKKGEKNMHHSETIYVCKFAKLYDNIYKICLYPNRK